MLCIEGTVSCSMMSHDDCKGNKYMLPSLRLSQHTGVKIMQIIQSTYRISAVLYYKLRNLYQNDGQKRIWRMERTAHELKQTASSYGFGVYGCQ